jgi:hypothetical protein
VSHRGEEVLLQSKTPQREPAMHSSRIQEAETPHTEPNWCFELSALTLHLVYFSTCYTAWQFKAEPQTTCVVCGGVIAPLGKENAREQSCKNALLPLMLPSVTSSWRDQSFDARGLQCETTRSLELAGPKGEGKPPNIRECSAVCAHDPLVPLAVIPS